MGENLKSEKRNFKAQSPIPNLGRINPKKVWKKIWGNWDKNKKAQI